MPKEKSSSSASRFNPLTGDEELECPYDKVHIIRKNRMARHLFKCAKNHPNSKLKECPFNRTHLYNPEDMAAHTAECPDRESFDLYKYNIRNGTNMPKPEKAEVPLVKNDDELWETIDGPSYDPKLKLENSTIIKHIIGGTKSERKKLREQDRERFLKAADEEDD